MQKGRDGKHVRNYHSSNLEHTDIFPILNGSLSSQANSTQMAEIPTLQSEESTPSPLGENAQAYCLPGVAQSLKEKGIHPEPASIIMQSWRISTAKQYKTYIKKWTSFCERHQYNSSKSNINTILLFLTELYNEKYSFSAINTAKSAISSFVICSENNNIADNTEITRFMKGIFNLRPPYPKYTVTWDVSQVLTFLKTLSPSDDLSLKHLTLKTVCLIALISGQRAQSIHDMDLDHCSVSENSSMKFFMTNLSKQVKPGIQQVPITVSKYTTDEHLCPLSSIQMYIQKTSTLRKSNKLWISFVKPHHAVGRQTISRWLKTILNMSGIDTSIFKAHSTRMASTSKASNMGVGLETILKTAGWSGAQNFKKFYQREVQPSGKSFADGVLSPTGF